MRSMSAIVASLFSDQMTEGVAPDIYIYRAHWAGVASSAQFVPSIGKLRGTLHRVLFTVQDLECFSILGQTPQIYERIYSVV